MSIIEHLAALRTRLMYSMIWLVAGFVLSWFVREPLFDFMLEPLRLGADGTEMAADMHHKDLAEPIFVFLKLCFLTGTFAGAPGIFYNVWKFVAPALYEDEKRIAIPFVIAATAFFFGGAAFCYYIVLPNGYNFLLQFSVGVSQPELMMQEYFAITTKLLLGFALIFELPVFSAFFSAMGVITHRTLLTYWRAAVVVAFAMAALFTPPDVFTQMMMAGPLMVLYALSIAVAWFFSRDDEKDVDDEEE
jgi:sec-independent protein translocase protein TatC